MGDINPEVQTEWAQSLKQVATKIGDRMSGIGSTLASYCSLELMEGDPHYASTPVSKHTDEGVLLECNLTAFDDIWMGVTAGIDELD
jgi:hypothetical protein